MSREALTRVANFRDLGGLVSADGRVVRHGRLHRSGALGRVGRRARDAFHDLHLRTVIDLRTDAEIARYGETLTPRRGRVVRVPIDSGDLTTGILPRVLRGEFASIPRDLLAQVNQVIVRDASGALREAVERIADPAAHPLLFHCSHGKDRAGVLAAVVLLALDVPWASVVDDYLRSNTTPTRPHRLQRRAVQLLAPVLAGRPFSRPDTEPLERLFVVAPENLERARAEMVALHGGVDAYLAGALGLTEVRRRQLKASLLEG